MSAPTAKVPPQARIVLPPDRLSGHSGLTRQDLVMEGRSVLLRTLGVAAVAWLVVPSAMVTAKSTTTKPVLDPANFVAGAVARNRYFPLVPGNQSVQQGALNRGHRRLPHRRVLTVTDVTKEIAGVITVLVLDQDFDGGEIAEQAIDYVAEDKTGNIWYLGSYTEAYEGGRFVNANDAWLAGVRGGQAGILMPANPATGTPKFVEAVVPGEGAATGRVLKTGQKECVPFRCYDNVLILGEGSERRFFAPEVGIIKTKPGSSSEQETEELVNFVRLSAAGLAEISGEADRLDDHARTTSERVFGKSARAKRKS